MRIRINSKRAVSFMLSILMLLTSASTTAYANIGGIGAGGSGGGSMKNKKLWITGCLLSFMCLAPAVNSQAVDSVMGIETVYASTQQTDRWEDGGSGIWRLKTADKRGYVSNSWFQDLDGSWYMINADGTMLSGLITDASTGKSYLMNVAHDGTFGKMLVTDGVYNLNGVNVYLTFNQAHDGSYGAVLSGLSEARSAGVAEKSLASIPTDSASAGQAQKPAEAKPAAPQGGDSEPYDPWKDSKLEGEGGTESGTVPNAVWG